MLRHRLVIPFALAASACACARSAPAPRLAVAMPLSGDLAATGRGLWQAVQLAVEEGAQGGAAAFEVVAYDDGGDPRQAVQVARRIAADDRVLVVIGHLTSGCSIEAAKVYAGAGLAMVAPTSTAPELTLQQERANWRGPRVVFRLPPSDTVQGAYAARYAFERFNLRRVAVVDDGTPYGFGLADQFAQRFGAAGGLVAARLSVRPGQPDFSAVVSKAVAARPDGLFYGGVYTDAGRLVRQLRERGGRAVFLSGDGAKADELFAIAGPAVDGAYFTVSGVPVQDLPAAADFIARYRRRFGQPPRDFDAYGYEAAKIALAAARKAGSDRARMLDVLAATDYDGLIGRVMFDGKGDSLKSLVTMTRASYAEKRFEPVY